MSASKWASGSAIKEGAAYEVTYRTQSTSGQGASKHTTQHTTTLTATVTGCTPGRSVAFGIEKKSVASGAIALNEAGGMRKVSVSVESADTASATKLTVTYALKFPPVSPLCRCLEASIQQGNTGMAAAEAQKVGDKLAYAIRKAAAGGGGGGVAPMSIEERSPATLSTGGET